MVAGLIEAHGDGSYGRGGTAMGLGSALNFELLNLKLAIENGIMNLAFLRGVPGDVQNRRDKVTMIDIDAHDRARQVAVRRRR